MKRLNAAIILVTIINVVLTVILLNKMGVFPMFAKKMNNKNHTNIMHERKVDDEEQVVSYGCKVCNRNEELVVKDIHVKVKDAYYTKNTKGLTLVSDIVDTKDGVIIEDGVYFLVVEADVWCDRPDEGMDFFKPANTFSGGLNAVGEIVGSSWYSTLTEKELQNPHVYINGKYLPQTPTEMSIIFRVDEPLGGDIKENDMYFAINTTGGQLSGQKDIKKRAGFINLGKVKVKK